METSESARLGNIDVPIGLLPDLTDFGIVPLDQGICEDTYENRRALRAAGMQWQVLFDDDGNPTEHILAISPEMQKARLQLRKGDLLAEPGNTNSDYLTSSQLLMLDNVEDLVPAWVLAATRQWKQIERKRRETGKLVWPSLEQAPGRCHALKMNGQRCANWHNGAATDGNLCRMHLGRHGTQQINTVDKARNRMKTAAMRAVDELEALLDGATSEPVRLKAATEILDRVGIRAGIEVESNVNIEVKPARDLIENRLKRLTEQKMQELPVLEAEVVEDGENNDGTTADGK